MVKSSPLLHILADRPVAYHPDVAKVVGSVKAGVFLSQLLYWSDKGADPDGWIWKTQGEMEQETALTRYEQETARKHLKEAGVLEEKLAKSPAKLHYRINTEELEARLREYYNPDCGKPTNQVAETPQSHIQESTPENTQDTLSFEEAFEQAGEKLKDREPDVLDGVLEYSSHASELDQSWFPPDLDQYLKPFQELFYRRTSREPTKTERGFWIKAVREWVERGYKPGDVERAWRYCEERETVISSPRSITWAFDELNAKGESDIDIFEDM